MIIFYTRNSTAVFLLRSTDIPGNIVHTYNTYVPGRYLR